MTVNREIIKQFTNHINLKLAEMEKGVYIELNGCILDLVKENERCCLAVTSDMHEMFSFLIHVDNFVYAFVELKG